MNWTLWNLFIRSFQLDIGMESGCLLIVICFDCLELQMYNWSVIFQGFGFPEKQIFNHWDKFAKSFKLPESQSRFYRWISEQLRAKQPLQSFKCILNFKSDFWKQFEGKFYQTRIKWIKRSAITIKFDNYKYLLIR